MSHDEAFSELAAAALDALDATGQAAVLAHAAGCAICTAELEALRAVASRLPESLPAEALGETATTAIRERLLARAASDIPRTPSAEFTRRRLDGASGHGRLSRRLAIAASLAFLISGAGYFRMRGERDDLRARLASAGQAEVAQRVQADELRAALSERDRELASITGPAVEIVTLTSAGTRSPQARMFWDKATGTWTFHARGIPVLAAGRTYQLWLVTASEKISAGVFNPSATGDAVHRTRYTLDPGALVAVAVTEEPSGGVPVATGPVVLIGAVQPAR